MFGILRVRFLFLIFFFVHTSAADKQSRENVIEAKNIQIVLANKELFLKLNSFLPTSRQLWIEFMLSKNITQFKVKLILDFIKKDNRNLNLMRHDFDGCKLLQMVYSKGLALKHATQELLKSSNLPAGCPLLANKLYYIRNYTMSAKGFPVVVPPMHWLLTIHFYIGKQYQGKIIIPGTVNNP